MLVVFFFFLRGGGGGVGFSLLASGQGQRHWPCIASTGLGHRTRLDKDEVYAYCTCCCNCVYSTYQEIIESLLVNISGVSSRTFNKTRDMTNLYSQNIKSDTTISLSPSRKP